MASHVIGSFTATLCCMIFFFLSTEEKNFDQNQLPWLYKKYDPLKAEKCCVLLLKDWDVATSETDSKSVFLIR